MVRATPSNVTNKNEDQLSLISFSDSFEDPSTTKRRKNRNNFRIHNKNPIETCPKHIYIVVEINTDKFPFTIKGH